MSADERTGGLLFGRFRRAMTGSIGDELRAECSEDCDRPDRFAAVSERGADVALGQRVHEHDRPRVKAGNASIRRRGHTCTSP